MAVAFSDPEIEPSTGHEIEGCGLLGEQNWVVPGQHQHGGAEAERRRARGEPSQKLQRCGDLVPAREVVLDEKGRANNRVDIHIALFRGLHSVHSRYGPPDRRAANAAHCLSVGLDQQECDRSANWGQTHRLRRESSALEGGETADTGSASRAPRDLRTPGMQPVSPHPDRPVRTTPQLIATNPRNRTGIYEARR